MKSFFAGIVTLIAACRSKLASTPSTTSTLSCAISLRVLSMVALVLVSSSSMIAVTSRPAMPPAALMSSIASSKHWRCVMPSSASSPVSGARKPILIGSAARRMAGMPRAETAVAAPRPLMSVRRLA